MYALMYYYFNALKPLLHTVFPKQKVILSYCQESVAPPV